MTLLLDNWIQPEWPAPAHVRAVMTARPGGHSLAPWDSLNLGDHVGDDPVHVQANRQLLQQRIGTRPVFLKQVHGFQVQPLHAQVQDGTIADACLTEGTGVACTIMVADCLPVLLCDTQGRWVAAAHAGWRGLAGIDGVGVIEALLATAPVSKTPLEDLLVWLGPCIGPQAFEVGPEVRDAFCSSSPAAEQFFKVSGPGKWLADLSGLARWRLQQVGVTRVYGNNSQPQWCTVTQASRFFSHRRDSRVLGQSGRMAACIWLTR